MTDISPASSLILNAFICANSSNTTLVAIDIENKCYRGVTFENVTANVTSAPPAFGPGCLETPRCKLFRTVEYSLCFLLALAGLLGNIISAIVLSKQRPRTSNVLLLQILSIVDALIMSIFIIMSVITLLILNKNYYGNAVFPATVALIFDVLHFTSNWLLVQLAVDRYIAVCYPYSAVRWCKVSRSYKVFVGIVIGSIIMTLPRAVVFYRDGDFNTLDNTYLIISTIFRYVLQIFILAFLNWRLVIATRKATERENQLSSMTTPLGRRGSTYSRRHFNGITTNLVAVVLIFLVCGTCRGIFFIIKTGFYNTLAPLERSHAWIYLLFSGITNIMMVFNSAVNFLVYCMFYKRFRYTVNHLLYVRCLKQFEPVQNNEISQAPL